MEDEIFIEESFFLRVCKEYIYRTTISALQIY